MEEKTQYIDQHNNAGQAYGDVAYRLSRTDPEMIEVGKISKRAAKQFIDRTKNKPSFKGWHLESKVLRNAVTAIVNGHIYFHLSGTKEKQGYLKGYLSYLQEYSELTEQLKEVDKTQFIDMVEKQFTEQTFTSSEEKWKKTGYLAARDFLNRKKHEMRKVINIAKSSPQEALVTLLTYIEDHITIKTRTKALGNRQTITLYLGGILFCLQGKAKKGKSVKEQNNWRDKINRLCYQIKEQVDNVDVNKWSEKITKRLTQKYPNEILSQQLADTKKRSYHKFNLEIEQNEEAVAPFGSSSAFLYLSPKAPPAKRTKPNEEQTSKDFFVLEQPILSYQTKSKGDTR